ncbi:hypothetical protein HID58_063363 [Brassica napus]|uniref:DUF1985 domain-containing protein n=1 Tax=Brassica napus TaxID=3708 RepID=A0ABQ8A420_BRANA|nr:hypothetical protein HID58_063363 [Brassica napus]
MGPKHKQPVVHEEDYVPIKTCKFIYCTFIILYGLQFPQSSSVIFFVPQVIDYCIDAETVKILGDAKIWNSLLIKNNKELLAGVDGLSEIKFDPIFEAVDKLMASLTSQVQVFTQTVLLENMPRKRCMSECIEACYSLDEMHETLSRKYGQSFKTTKNTYDYFLKGRHGSKAYKQLSLVRAAQRKSEKLPKAQSQKQQQLKVDKVCEAVDKSKFEKKEQAGHQVQSSEHMEQAESLLPIQDEVELPKPTEVQSNTEQEQDGDQVQSSEQEEQAESLLPIQDEVELPKPTEVQSNTEQKEQDGYQVQSSDQKEQAESLLPIQDEVELPKSTEAQRSRRSKLTLINSQKEILEAITSQNKMLESVMNLQTEIATKDDLESLERDLERRLEAIGEDITLQVANGIQEILTSASKTSVDKFEKAVTSKVNISR